MSLLHSPAPARGAGKIPVIALVMLRAIGARIGRRYERHRATLTRLRELDDLMTAEEHILRDIGVTRTEVMHQRTATRIWF